MVKFTTIKSSNASIAATFPPGLVAVFVGATQGIGAATLKCFARYTLEPRAYFIGRSEEAARDLTEECKRINPDGDYIFIKADVSLIRVVDEVCREIADRETRLNVIFLIAGVLDFSRSESAEGIHILAALNYYSRMRFIMNLLPLIKCASAIRRVVNCGGGSKEGPVDASDFTALHIPLSALRGHLSSMVTLGLEKQASTAPEVSFVNDYPGTVLDTALYRGQEGPPSAAIETIVSLEETGERHVYMATSAQFPPLNGETLSVQLVDECSVSNGSSGARGSGVYSLDWDCSEGIATQLLEKLRRERIDDRIWQHTLQMFEKTRKNK